MQVAYWDALLVLGLADGAMRRSRRMVEINATPARVRTYRKNALTLVGATYTADLAQYRYLNAKGRAQNGG